ncbi:MAG: tripartite tricarboxylate transporter substrate binding protein [Comamonadaceae bacterium]|nr:MAG: tripartite tricarboxylate transporter substrate binding protein [Comamonadaceae bacterium]
MRMPLASMKLLVNCSKPMWSPCVATLAAPTGPVIVCSDDFFRPATSISSVPTMLPGLSRASIHQQLRRLVNMFTRRSFHSRMVAGLATATAIGHPVLGLAQDAGAWPQRPIRLIVPTVAGGGVDNIGRAIAEKMAVRLGQPVIVDNKPGAATLLGNDIVAKAPPDGYTLLINFSSFVMSALLYKKVPYDLFKDFAPVALTNYGLMVFAASANVPANNMKEFIALAKAKPGAVSYGSTGTGSAGHMYAELLSRDNGVKLLHVPYKGSGPMMIDMIGGQVQTGFTTLADAMPHVKTGKVRILGVLGTERMPSVPDVPTFAETGLKGFEQPAFWGVYAPAGTPDPILAKLTDAVIFAVRQPDVQTKMAATGLKPAGLGPRELASTLRRDYDTYEKLVKELNITMD